MSGHDSTNRHCLITIDDVEVHGEVTSLERTYEASDGTITVSGVVDGKPRRILLWLSHSDYELASRANAEKRPISCVCKLEKEGASWVQIGRALCRDRV